MEALTPEMKATPIVYRSAEPSDRAGLPSLACVLEDRLDGQSSREKEGRNATP